MNSIVDEVGKPCKLGGLGNKDPSLGLKEGNIVTWITQRLYQPML